MCNCVSLSSSVKVYPDATTLAPSLSYNEQLKRKLVHLLLSNISLADARRLLLESREALYQRVSTKGKLVVASVGDAVEQFRFVLLGSRVSIFPFCNCNRIFCAFYVIKID